MRRNAGAATGATLTILLCHGAVLATDQGVFERVLRAFMPVWMRMTGQNSLDSLGPAWSSVVLFASAAAGFIAFWAIARHPRGRDLWKPFGAALLLSSAPLRALVASIAAGPLHLFGIGGPCPEVLAALAVLAVMLWSIDARLPQFRRAVAATAR